MPALPEVLPHVDDEDSLTKLVIQLLQRNPDASPREEAVRVQVRVFIEQVKKLGSGKGRTQPSAHTDESGIAKLFEEVKIMVRELPERVDEKVRSVTRRGSSRKLRRIHPMMIEELTAHPAIRELPAGPAAAWVWLLSLFKDDLPWLPELGHDMYEALLSRNPKKVLEARDALLPVVEALTRGPIFHEIFRPDDEEVYFLLTRHLPELLDRFASVFADEAPTTVRRRPLIRRAAEHTPPKEG